METLFEAAMGPQIGGALVAMQYGFNPALRLKNLVSEAAIQGGMPNIGFDQHMKWNLKSALQAFMRHVPR